MRTRPANRRDSRYIAAFVAAAFFYLAGAIFVILAFWPRQAAPLFLGAMFLCVGSIWVVIGAKYKTDSDRN